MIICLLNNIKLQYDLHCACEIKVHNDSIISRIKRKIKTDDLSLNSAEFLFYSDFYFCLEFIFCVTKIVLWTITQTMLKPIKINFHSW